MIRWRIWKLSVRDSLACRPFCSRLSGVWWTDRLLRECIEGGRQEEIGASVLKEHRWLEANNSRQSKIDAFGGENTTLRFQ